MSSLARVLVGVVTLTTFLSAQTPAVQKILADIKAKDKGMLAVSEEDGRFLRLMVASSGAKRALEIGGASGYSAIWIGHGAARHGRTAGHHRIRSGAREGARRQRPAAGLSDIVQVVAGDAFQQIPKVSGTFDFVFLDAWKKDYKRFFDMVYPRLDKGGLFLAAQRRQQAQRDGGLPRRHPETAVASGRRSCRRPVKACR